MIRNYARRLRGSARVLRRIPGQRRAGRMSREAAAEHAARRVKSIVRYAAATVPWYRDMFQAHGIEPGDIRQAADLDRLPVVEKSDLRKSPELFRADSAEGRAAIPFVTSGSTGEPLTVYHDPDSIVDNFAYCEPEKQVVREFLGMGRNIRRLAVIYDTSTNRKIWSVYRDQTFIPTPHERSLGSITSPIEEVIQRINEVRPDVLIGYGSYLEALFRYVMEKDIPMHLPAVVNYGADAMTEPGREMIRERFGIPIVSRYGAVECFRIAFSCGHGSGFHVRDDICHLRLADEDGRNVPQGQVGQVVISNLVNRGSVLLNYRLGDMGALSDAPCACGRQWPLLTGLDGRTEDILELKTGEIVHPRTIWSVIKDQRGVLRYQLVQLEPDRFELRLETTERSVFDRAAMELRQELGRYLVNCSIECSRVERFATPAGGKFRPVIALRSGGD